MNKTLIIISLLFAFSFLIALASLHSSAESDESFSYAFTYEGDPNGTAPYYTFGTAPNGQYEYATLDSGDHVYIANMGTMEGSSTTEAKDGCGAAVTTPAGLILLVGLGATALTKHRKASK